MSAGLIFWLNYNEENYHTVEATRVNAGHSLTYWTRVIENNEGTRAETGKAWMFKASHNRPRAPDVHAIDFAYILFLGKLLFTKFIDLSSSKTNLLNPLSLKERTKENYEMWLQTSWITLNTYHKENIQLQLSKRYQKKLLLPSIWQRSFPRSPSPSWNQSIPSRDKHQTFPITFQIRGSLHSVQFSG